MQRLRLLLRKRRFAARQEAARAQTEAIRMKRFSSRWRSAFTPWDELYFGMCAGALAAFWLLAGVK